MIFSCDESFEKGMIDGALPIAVPIEIACDGEGNNSIIVYPRYEKVAREFESKFGNTPFSADALRWLDLQLSADVKSFGYEYAHGDENTILEFEFTSFRQECKDASDADIRIVEREAQLEGIDTSLIGDYLEITPAAIAVVENKLVSVSMINDFVDDPAGHELFVETLPEYRNMGYAKKVVLHLSCYFAEKGEKVFYKCAENNLASVRTARSAGFKLKNKRYSYVCYSD